MPTYVYILASQRNGTLYVGSTDDPAMRIHMHRTGKGSKFVNKYKVHRLVYLEPHERAEYAILRERRIKAWKRKWKLRLIEEVNPNWDDLYDQLTMLI